MQPCRIFDRLRNIHIKARGALLRCVARYSTFDHILGGFRLPTTYICDDLGGGGVGDPPVSKLFSSGTQGAQQKSYSKQKSGVDKQHWAHICCILAYVNGWQRTTELERL